MTRQQSMKISRPGLDIARDHFGVEARRGFQPGQLRGQDIAPGELVTKPSADRHGRGVAIPVDQEIQQPPFARGNCPPNAPDFAQ